MRIGYFGPWRGSHVHAVLAFQLANDMLKVAAAGHTMELSYADELGVDHVRNAALERARKTELDWLVMQDADVFAGCAPILEMVECGIEHGAAIVTAPVMLRRNDIVTNVEPEPTSSEPYQGETSGAGLIAIRIAEIDRIAEGYDGPWFVRSYHDKRQTRVAVTGDLYFSGLVKARGGRLVVHAGIPTTHTMISSLAYEPPPTSGVDEGEENG